MRDPAKDTQMREDINSLVNVASTLEPAEVFERTRAFEDKYLNDPDFDQSDLDVTQLLYSFYETYKRYGDALRIYRRDRAIRGMVPFHNHLEFIALLDASGERAIASDFTDRPDNLGSGRSILIAGAPKSGTTFVESTLMELSGMPFVPFNLDYSLYSGSLVPQLMVNQLENDVIAKEHCFATQLNIAAIQALVPHTIVLTRNIFDCLVSMRDMQVQPTVGFTSAFYEPHLNEMDEVSQLDAVASRFASFYIEFFVSWTRAICDGAVNARLWTYDDLMADKLAGLREVTAYCGIQASDAEIEKAAGMVGADRAKSRLNVGRTGRGVEAFSDEQKDRVNALTRFYPDIDFAPIGLS